MEAPIAIEDAPIPIEVVKLEAVEPPMRCGNLETPNGAWVGHGNLFAVW